VVEDFGPRFAPSAVLVYVGDTGEKWGYFDKKMLSNLGVTVDSHGKMPDVVLYYPKREWLLLVESVTSHGPVDAKRHEELARLFAGAKVGLVYVTAFPSRSMMARYLGEIAWETEVWVADAPSHLIHFNGPRFLGPYSDKVK
jgi:type II restriction enzyme